MADAPAYKLIACDLDETLLDGESRVCPRNVRAVRAAREAGARVAIATGRGFPSVRYELEALGLADRAGEYVIALNGADVRECAGGRTVAFEGLPFDFADDLYRRGLGFDVCVQVYTADAVYAHGLTDEERRYLGRRYDGMVEVDERSLAFLRGEGIAKVLCSSVDVSYLRAIAAELEPATGGADVSFSSNRYLEFNRKGVNKGAGLERLARILGVGMAETIAIGDNWNDVAMLDAAGLAAGVANVVDGVREHCDYVARATNSEGGVAEVIERFVLDR